MPCPTLTQAQNMLGGDDGLAHPIGDSHSRTRDLDAVKQDGCRSALYYPAANRWELLWTATGTNTLCLGETLLRAKEVGDFGAPLARTLLGPEALNSDPVQGCRNCDVVRVAGRVAGRHRPSAKAVFLTLEAECGLIPSPSGKGVGNGSNTPCGGAGGD